MHLTEKDLEQISAKGLTIETVLKQINTFKEGIPFVTLSKAANIGSGIIQFTTTELLELAKTYDQKISKLDIMRFVPASGAATRMFKELFKFLDQYDFTKESINSYLNYEKAVAIRLFLIGFEKLPFYEVVLKATYEKYPRFNDFSEGEQLYAFVKTMLRNHGGLNYGELPKGILPFHKYKSSVNTAFEEHLFEAARYGAKDGKAKLHFTVSPDHLVKFEQEFEKKGAEIERKSKTNFEISYSFQNQSTDTIAVDENNEPFRLNDGSILFRPGGHGALIENLNSLDTDIVFIKNIDNVVVRKYQDELTIYKKALAGKLLQIQNQVFSILESIENALPDEEELKDISSFLTNDLNITMPVDFEKFADSYKLEYLQNTLNRPIRVCGMVLNEGEPGGGPFWIKNEHGIDELQIIESNQINTSSNSQNRILQQSTHFNPVDLVCAMKNYKGEKFDLLNFVDPNMGFITHKTVNGKAVKALELPGLWNGAMANWISIFVEVPLTTFNPVKTVNDLLKSAHQVKMF